MEYSECLPIRLNPLDERSSFSQVRVLVLTAEPALDNKVILTPPSLFH